MQAWYLYPLIIIAGFIAGFINTLAGSGSLITLPILIFSGLPANIANGTNRIAILMQNIVAVKGFEEKKLLDKRGAILFGVPTLLGAILGAQIAITIDEKAFEKIIGVVLLIMLVIILVRPANWLKGTLENISDVPNFLVLLLFFFVGVYGGFIQAGVGIFLLSTLVLGVGYDLVRANAVKVSIVLFFTIAALVIFVNNGQVDWRLGIMLGIGNMAGAWVATNYAAELGAVWVRRMLISIVAVSTIKLLGISDFIVELIANI